MSTDLQVTVENNQRRAALSLVSMLGALVVASSDEATTECVESNQFLSAIIDTVGDFVDAAGDLFAANARYVDALEYKAQFTSTEALGDEVLTELREAAKAAGKANVAEVVSTPEGRAALQAIAGPMLHYILALETTVASLRPNATEPF